ncbi:MAG: ribonucleoside diphosphate reductase beta subunit [Edafosvirus sp.]|uniref:Ribonucleoside-diphosphate reductase small chain n=1 Tax=Edafosvirus sp. TaxID=2487765 RepID=A0A3G4ZU71_9VIRU|nr:MAG: ribonucleoside diphosphate reductase beta subunit [Edafosvirus sp.]
MQNSNSNKNANKRKLIDYESLENDDLELNKAKHVKTEKVPQLLASHINNKVEKTKEDIEEEEEGKIIDATEPILNPNKIRFTMFPLEYHDIWKMYKTQRALFWQPDEINFSKDYDDFLTLTSDEQHFIKMILAFFAASDGIVNFNISERFANDVKIMEAKVAYDWQKMMENIHGEVYSQMIENIIKDAQEKERLYNAIETIPAVKKMADWAFKWIQSPKRFAYRVIAFAIVEGIFFSGAFAAIYWIKKYRCRGKQFLQGLIQSNDFIARDEGMHCDFACLLYSHLVNKLPTSEVNIIMEEAVVISKEFIIDSLPCKLIGMNSDMMSDYIEFIGDRLLIALGYPKKYNKQNPFPFMESIGMIDKKNFFEERPREYASANVFNKGSKNSVNLVADF